MNPHEAIEFISKRLRRRHLKYWLILGFAAFLHVLGFSLLLSFFSHAGGLALFAAALLACVYWAARHGCFRTYSVLDAAIYLDENTASKDRFKSFVELKDFLQDAAKSELLESQLARILEESSQAVLPRLQMPRAFYAALWALLLPWCGVLGLLIYEKMLPEYNPEQVAMIEEVLQKEELPPELREKLETLKESLEEHPLLDAPVSDALAEAENELDQSFEDKAFEEKETQERIVEEAQTAAAPEKRAPEEPSPTPTPQAVPQQDSQSSKDQDKQTENQKQNEEQKQQEKQDKGEGKSQEQKSQEDQGKDSKEQSQSKEQSKSAQGNGQGEGKAVGQGQAEQQSGQGSGEKESSAKQDSSSAQGKEEGKEQNKGESKEQDSKDQKGEGDSQSKQGKEGAKEGDAKKEGDKGSKGSEKGEGNKEGSGLDETKKALNEIKDQIEKETQQQKQEGKQKESKSQKEGKEGKQDSQQGKDRSQSGSDKKDKQEGKEDGSSGKDQNQQDKEKSKPEEGKESNKESSGDTGGKSAMPAPGEMGKTPDLNMALGTKEQERERSKDIEVPAGDEQFDSRFAGKEGEMVQNKKGLSPKTGLADVQLAKPEARKGVEEQYIPPEYEGVLSGR